MTRFTAVAAFLLAFPALFSIINPIGGALIFNGVTAHLGHAERVRIAGRVGLYSLLVLLGALWGGAYVLNFFGVSVGALRIAGGAVVALSAYHLLMSNEQHEERKRRQADPGDAHPDDMAFFPLTLPYTVGPGAITVAITLGAAHPTSGIGLIRFYVGMSVAAVVNAALVWIAYRYADQVTGWLSASGRSVLTRLIAFLLLSVGVQILVSGIGEVVAGLRAP